MAFSFARSSFAYLLLLINFLGICNSTTREISGPCGNPECFTPMSRSAAEEARPPPSLMISTSTVQNAPSMHISLIGSHVQALVIVSADDREDDPPSRSTPLTGSDTTGSGPVRVARAKAISKGLEEKELSDIVQGGPEVRALPFYFGMW
jgi:hypothetical protein